MMTKHGRKPLILVLGATHRPLERAGADVAQFHSCDGRAKYAIRSGAVDGLLLTGGGDVNPLLYSDTWHPKCYGVNDERDEAEWDAITAADEMGIPVMGICRGAQMINVAYGGTLHQDLGDLRRTHRHDGVEHMVRAAPGSRLDAAWRGKQRGVVSIHHQAVKDVAPGFVATGWSLDGVIEAIEATEGWILGVQFHPEMATYEAHCQRLFDRFVAAAAKHAGLEWTLPERTGRAAMLRVEANAARRNAREHHKASRVVTAWKCFRCDIRFDERDDHVDHMLFIHGVDLGDRSKR